MNNHQHRLVLLLIAMTVSLFAQDSLNTATIHPPANSRPRIGLVLSGGGAMGFAHIGILKMLDSLQIPIDYIAGTSMGGIIAALYSVGYSGETIERMVKETDWEDAFSDTPGRDMLPYQEKIETGRYQIQMGMTRFKPAIPSGLIFGQKVYLLFSQYTFPYERIRNFDELPIPFRCVAADLLTGNEVVLQSGSLSRAMRATMAIPTVFSPVDWGDSLLVDGGMVNNLPIDVVRNMGADIVIAVDVAGHSIPREQLSNALAIMQRSLHLFGIEKWKRNVELADIYIAPDLNEFTIGDFTSGKVKDIIKVGDESALQNRSKFLHLKSMHQLRILSNSEDLSFLKGNPELEDVQIIGTSTTPFEILYDSLRLSLHPTFDFSDFEYRVAKLKSTGLFMDVQYEIVPMSDNTIRLILYVEDAITPVIYSISVQGNQNLPFSTIYSTLRILPGEKLDIRKLSAQIMELYGLGYFESIHYEIIPVKDKYVHLVLTVNEHPLRKLRIGLRYDYRNKLVMAIGLKINSFIIPGLYLRNEFQLSGLRQFENKIYYPLQTKNSQSYPYLRHYYKDIPTFIYDGEGTRIANYRDHSSSIGLGMGWIIGRDVNFEAEIRSKQLAIAPDIAFPDPDQFPSWSRRIHELIFQLNVDKLNDLLMPTRGFRIYALYEKSTDQAKLKTSYWAFQCLGEIFIPAREFHLFHLMGFSGVASESLPVYKYFNVAAPHLFIGMDYDQLVGHRVQFLRIDYLYHISHRMCLKFSANMAFNIRYGSGDYPVNVNHLSGVGIGFCTTFPLGLFEVMQTWGSRGMLYPDNFEERTIFRLGTNF